MAPGRRARHEIFQRHRTDHRIEQAAQEVEDTRGFIRVMFELVSVPLAGRFGTPFGNCLIDAFVLDLADLRVGTQQLLALTFANVAISGISIFIPNIHIT